LSVVGFVTLVSAVVGRISAADVDAWTEVAVAAALIAVVVVPLAFVAAMRRVGMPLGDVVGAAHRVGEGDYSARVAEKGPPFLRTIARAFNTMTARLEAQDRQRRDMMADIAHELRTPLTVVRGRLEGLLDGVYPRDDTHLGEVLHETELLARLVEDLRTLANAESGALRLQREPTDMALLIHESVRSLEGDSAAATSSLSRIRVDAPDDLPIVEVDPLRIREVLVNLVTNAVRHSTDGTAISVRAEPHAGGVAVAVADTGPGIAPEELPRIFDRFHKGAGSHGSGLGLTIARNLVRAHGGEITASSEVGRGTTVVFTVPGPPAPANGSSPGGRASEGWP
jgi:two-component system OmpR family sensor kinase/two-component system sensor histidine kinase BaeS